MAPKVGTVDPAALATASVAAIVSVMVAEGPFNSLSLAIGVTILLVLFVHDAEPQRSRRESLHVSAVTAFGLMMLAAFPLELLFEIRSEPLRRCVSSYQLLSLDEICFVAKRPDNVDSAVPPVILLAVWVLCLAAAFVVDRRRVRSASTLGELDTDAPKANPTASATAEPSGESLRIEYQSAQESAQHHDALVWSVTSVMWGGSLVLMGFIVAAPRVPQNRPLVTIVGALGVALTFCAWRFARQFNAVTRQKYLRCKEIEAVLHMRQHSELQWSASSQRRVYSLLMSSFIVAWLFLILAAWLN